MTDLARATYQRLMTEIADLEDKVESLKARPAAGSADKQAAELERLAGELNDKRRELARISDGCGRPHHR